MVFSVQHVLCKLSVFKFRAQCRSDNRKFFLIQTLTLYDVVVLYWRGSGDKKGVHMDPALSKFSFPVIVPALPCNMLVAGFELISTISVWVFEKWVEVTVWQITKKRCECLRVCERIHKFMRRTLCFYSDEDHVSIWCTSVFSHIFSTLLLLQVNLFFVTILSGIKKRRIQTQVLFETIFSFLFF